jgi:Family of unknown function (DUF6491)
MSCLPWRFAAMSLAACALALGAACASNPSAAHAAQVPLPGKNACIFTVELSDWVVLDDSTLIVYAPLHRQPYLLKLFAPITGLSFHESLGFEDSEHNGQLCRGDYVLARGELPQRMPISALQRISPEQAKQLLSAAGHT